jgi:RNA polymerase II-associated protein 3
LCQDLQRALNFESDNPSIKEELQRVQTLILERAKRSEPARPALPLPKPRTRRVPIQVIDIPPTATAQDDLLTPVSSRPLNRESPTTPVSETSENGQPEQIPPPSTFQETKQARSTKYGGGIFRSSGSHTIFKSEPSSAPRPKPQTDQPSRPVMNLAAFTRSWNTLTTDKHKWALLQQIPPTSFSRFFGSSLEADILSSILGVLLTALSFGESEQISVKEYMVYLPQVPRFFLIYTFLPRRDKDRAKDVWTLLDGAGITSEEVEESKKSWDV